MLEDYSLIRRMTDMIITRLPKVARPISASELFPRAVANSQNADPYGYHLGRT